jgi:tetratricopeptide (TPR) repeat protein
MQRPYRRYLSVARAAAIVTLFTMTLGKATPAQQPRPIAVLLQSGDSAYSVGRGARPHAIASYREAVRRDSAASSRAVYRLATMLAEDGLYREAITLHLLYATLEPNDREGALGLARTYTWAGRSDDALAIYRAVLAAEPDYRDAAMGAGQVLAWSARFEESVATYRAWLQHQPSDRDATLALARTLAWWGKLSEAARIYDSLYASDGSTEARKGLALVTAWQGDLAGSERLWRGLAGEMPSDVEVWTGLAQVLRWRGQPFEARDALHNALTIDPTHRDARSQRRWLDAELAPTVHGRVLSLGDSDGNRAHIYTIEGTALPWRRAAVRFDAAQVRAELGGAQRVSQTARGSVRVRLPWGADWTARLELGANGRPNAGSANNTQVRAVWQLGLAGRLSNRANGELRVGRSVVDETIPLIVNGVRLTSADGDYGAQIGDRLNVSASLSAGSLRGDSAANARLSSVLAARWVMAQGRSFGITARMLKHSREARDGYFSPRRYAHVELSARARHGRELGWAFSGDAGLGVQYADYHAQQTTQPTQRLAGSASYVFAPGLEWTVSGVLANVATTGTSSASSYRYGSLSLGGRVPLR